MAKSELSRLREDKNEKVTKPEELVRLYDLLLQNTSDLSDIVSSGRGRKPEEVSFAAECEYKVLAFRAERCFYVAVIQFGWKKGRSICSVLSCSQVLKEDMAYLFVVFHYDEEWQGGCCVIIRGMWCNINI